MSQVGHLPYGAGVANRTAEGSGSVLSWSGSGRVVDGSGSPAPVIADDASTPIEERLWSTLVRLAWVSVPAVRDLRSWPGSKPGLGSAEEAPAAAAAMMVAAARVGRDDLLRDVLRPDPQHAGTTWTVACFQIGDLAPSAIRDFSDPVAAVRELMDCGKPMHVAAELVASDRSGIRWTAMVRTGDRVVFQLFADRTTGSTSGPDPVEVTAMGVRWARRLAACARQQAGCGDTAVHLQQPHEPGGLLGFSGSGWGPGAAWDLATSWRTVGPGSRADANVDPAVGGGQSPHTGLNPVHAPQGRGAGGARAAAFEAMAGSVADLVSEIEVLGHMFDAVARRLGRLSGGTVAGPRYRAPRSNRGTTGRTGNTSGRTGNTDQVASVALFGGEGLEEEGGLHSMVMAERTGDQHSPDGAWAAMRSDAHLVR